MNLLETRRMLTLVSVLCVVAAPTGAVVVATNWVESASSPVYNPGKAYYPSILKSPDGYMMWYDPDGDVAVSQDGVSWSYTNTASGLLNPRHMNVEYNSSLGIYQIWYWNSAELYSIRAIRYAESTNGFVWLNDQAITQENSSVIDSSNSANWNRGSYGPCDVIINSSASNSGTIPWDYTYVMYYDGTTGGKEDIGLAYSSNGIYWIGYNGGTNPVLSGSGGSGWDYNYVSRATILKDGNNYHMWYSGGSNTMNQGIGYASSDDGIEWTKVDVPVFHKDDGVSWRDNRTYTPVVIGTQMWFSGKSSVGGIYQIGYAGPHIPEPFAFGFVGFLFLMNAVAARRLRDAWN